MVIAGCVGGGGLVGCGAWVGGGACVGGGGVGDRKRVGITSVGKDWVGKPVSCVGNKGVIAKGVTLGKKPPKGVGLGGRGVTVTTCGPCVRTGVGVARCGAVPHKKKPAQ